MSKYATSFALTVFTGLLASVTVSALCSPAARAADDCLTEPNLGSGHAHWYYRINPTNHRRCWHLGPSGTKLRQTFLRTPRPLSRPAIDTPGQAPLVGDGTPAIVLRSADEPRVAQSMEFVPVSVGMRAVDDRAEPKLGDKAAALASSAMASAERPAVDPTHVPQLRSDLSQIRSDHTPALLAAALALAATTGCTMFTYSVARRRRRRDLLDRDEEDWSAFLGREQAFITHAGRGDSMRLSEPAPRMTHEEPKEMLLETPRPVAAQAANAHEDSSEPAHEIEQTLQQLALAWERTAA